MAVGAPALATPFTAEELTIVAWLKKKIILKTILHLDDLNFEF